VPSFMLDFLSPIFMAWSSQVLFCWAGHLGWCVWLSVLGLFF
jgi:hypothetical protein